MCGATREHDTPPPSPFRGSGDEDETLEPDEVVVDDDGMVLEEVETLEEGPPPEDEDDDMDAAAAEEEEPVEDMSRLTLDGHKGSAFCVAVSQAGDAPLIASGGEDDCARVWRADTGALVLTTSGHKDSVTQVAFSSDGKLLAAGDMAGLVQVYRVPGGEKVWEFDTGLDLTWMAWHSVAPALLAGTQDGQGWMWRIPRGDTKTLASHGSGWSKAALLADGAHLLAGYEDGSARLWQLRSGQPVQQFSGAAAHSSPVTCAAAHRDNVLLATGAMDGWVRLYSATSGKLLTTLAAAPDAGASTDADDDEEGGPQCVEAAAFAPTETPLLATATVGGVLTLWDAVAQRARHRLSDLSGVTCLQWTADGARLLVGCLDGEVVEVDARAGGVVRRLTSVPSSVLDMELTADGKAAVVAMDDGKVRLFDLAQPAAT
ncbi:Angio-associated migratory cell protein [Amphibalanus amphitrite]|uniref:Angio-associated migratory cell protein n=1 Tax=Amphibalanus amphitrite TaxID=1232801 RepID=A0A6A4W471_AMPAM|nr:Angio-associated migratory cell protein [Amphibalanus amphitrite]